MKRIYLIILAAILAAYPLCAQADSVQGSWSGSARALGRRVSISCSFNGSGGFSASGGGMSVSGSYSVSDGGVTLSAKGTSIFLSLSTSDGSQSLSGSGRYRGIKGSLYLSRRVSNAQSSTPFGQWMLEKNGVEYAVSIYEGGYMGWSELDGEIADQNAFNLLRDGFKDGTITDMEGVISAIEAGSAPDECVAECEKKSDVLVVKPLAGDVPECWNEFLVGSAYEMPYKLKDGKLLLMPDSDGDGYAFSFTGMGRTDEKPAGEAFLPYVTFERGDSGEGVKRVQQSLIDKGFLDDKADGSFGPKTEKAVMEFDKANGLAPDGKADPETLDTLYSK